MSQTLLNLLVLSVLMTGLGRGQSEAPLTPAQPIHVSLSVSIDSKTVPLNRTVVLRIEVSWEGNLDQVSIGQVTEPVLSNLDIVGTTASNRVLALASGQKAIKEIDYTLKPKALGMGYIEPVTVSYEDRSSHKVDNLRTQRLSVEVISAVAEDEAGWSKRLTWMIAALALICGVYLIFSILKRRKREPDVPKAPVRLLEEDYIQELRADGGPEPASARDGFAKLSRLLRRYLAEKYGLPALEVTTRDLIEQLPTSGLDQALVSRCQTLLTIADVVKFSGQEAPPAEFQLAYTTLETLLERNLAESRNKSVEVA